jgi:hypothetical protein
MPDRRTNRSIEEDPERERRIAMQIVVDAYDGVEQMSAWHCYLDDRLPFPFEAISVDPGRRSPLKAGQAVRVIEMADADECASGMRVVVEVNADEDDEVDEFDVPLESLDFADPKVSVDARQALEDWRYWVGRGYRF